MSYGWFCNWHQTNFLWITQNICGHKSKTMWCVKLKIGMLLWGQVRCNKDFVNMSWMRIFNFSSLVNKVTYMHESRSASLLTNPSCITNMNINCTIFHGRNKAKNLRGATESYGNEKYYYLWVHKQCAKHTPSRGGLGACPHRKILKKKCYKIESGSKFGQ